MYYDTKNKLIRASAGEQPMSVVDFYRRVKEHFGKPEMMQYEFPIRVSINKVIIMLHGWEMSRTLKTFVKSSAVTIEEPIKIPTVRLLRS